MALLLFLRIKQWNACHEMNQYNYGQIADKRRNVKPTNERKKTDESVETNGKRVRLMYSG